MPYKDAAARRLANREAQRRWRTRRKAKASGAVQPAPPPAPADPAQAVADWSRDRLVVPPGHPLAGQPMALPDYGVKFLRDALTHRESLLCIARKNSKSGIVAVLCLALLAGPLKRPGLRIGTVSVTREKSAELLRQMREIAEASRLDGLEFRKSPSPGWVRTPDGGTAEFLSADKSAGHSSGFDYAIADELGIDDGARPGVDRRYADSHERAGRSVYRPVDPWGVAHAGGDDRASGSPDLLPSTCTRRRSPRTASIDIHDLAIWAAGNPGLACGIKSSVVHVGRSSAGSMTTPSDRASFVAFDLNLPQSPTREMIFPVADYRRCIVEELPPRRGPVCLGLDMGEATSASACFAIWPETGRCEAWMAFGDNPSPIERGRRDGARYDVMVERGELRVYPGRVTPVATFLADVASELSGCRVHRLAADGYKDAETKDFLDMARVRWPYEFRRVGAGKDGGRDVRSLQRLVLNQTA